MVPASFPICTLADGVPTQYAGTWFVIFGDAAMHILAAIVGWIYIKGIVWAKHIVLCGRSKCEQDKLGRVTKFILKRHDSLPRALAVSCVDNRFSDIGGIMLAWIVFGILYRETGKWYLVYGLRLAGPDTLAPTSGNEAATELYFKVLNHHCEILQPGAIVSTAHEHCAGMCVDTDRHLTLQRKAAYEIHRHYPYTHIMTLLARARYFGWRVEHVATIAPMELGINLTEETEVA